MDRMDVEFSQSLLPGVLTELPGALGTHCVNQGLNEVAKAVARYARDRVPKDRGDLAVTIRPRRARIARRRGYAWPGFAQVRAGGPGARHANIIEAGTETRYQPTPGGGLRFVGRGPAFRYLEGAAYAVVGQVPPIMRRGIERGFARVQAELRGKAKLRRGTARLAAADVAPGYGPGAFGIPSP